MQSATGWYYDGRRFLRGTVLWEDGVIIEANASKARDPLAKGVILPALWNAHVHLGDAVVTEELRGTIEDLVAPPHGLKHRVLARAKDEAVIAAMRRAMATMLRTGTVGFTDFREGGIEGLKLLYAALATLPMRHVTLGRPAGLSYEPKEVASLLRACEGIGVSSYVDWPPGEVEKLAADARRAGKPFAIHCSERIREDIDAVLDLKPAFLVHMVQATDSDLERCADAGVPVVVCPRSNAFFGLTPDISRMQRAGVELRLGTDNAMINRPSMLREMEFAYRIARLRGEVPAREILDMALRGRKGIDPKSTIGLQPGGPADLFVLDLPGGPEASASVVQAVASDVVLMVARGQPWRSPRSLSDIRRRKPARRRAG